MHFSSHTDGFMSGITTVKAMFKMEEDSRNKLPKGWDGITLVSESK